MHIIYEELKKNIRICNSALQLINYLLFILVGALWVLYENFFVWEELELLNFIFLLQLVCYCLKFSVAPFFFTLQSSLSFVEVEEDGGGDEALLLLLCHPYCYCLHADVHLMAWQRRQNALIPHLNYLQKLKLKCSCHHWQNFLRHHW